MLDMELVLFELCIINRTCFRFFCEGQVFWHTSIDDVEHLAVIPWNVSDVEATATGDDNGFGTSVAGTAAFLLCEFLAKNFGYTN